MGLGHSRRSKLFFGEQEVMDKFRVFISAHKNRDALNKCLESLDNSDLNIFTNSCVIINNFGVLNYSDIYDTSVDVDIVNNRLRLKRSTGHLTRTWNQAIINGFEDLRRPKCEFVVCIQDDTILKPDCFSKLNALHARYDFIQNGLGDQIMSFSAEGVRKIGIFDERMCGIGFHEREYFDRAVRLAPEKVSINDYGHSIERYGEENLPADHFIRVWVYSHNQIHEDLSKSSQYLVEQWHDAGHTSEWDSLLSTLYGDINNHPRFFTYPYFEKDIETLNEQNYYGVEKVLRPYVRPEGDWVGNSLEGV